jgi:Predicted membrane-associated, metal-dependent hydrolase
VVREPSSRSRTAPETLLGSSRRPPFTPVGELCDEFAPPPARITAQHVEPVAEAVAGPNVVLIVVDTLRADHLASYGYGRDTDAGLGRFLRHATRSEDDLLLWHLRNLDDTRPLAPGRFLPAHQPGSGHEADPM